MIWRLPPNMVAEEIAKSGAHEKSFPIFNVKSEFLTLKTRFVFQFKDYIIVAKFLITGNE